MCGFWPPTSIPTWSPRADAGDLSRDAALESAAGAAPALVRPDRGGDGDHAARRCGCAAWSRFRELNLLGRLADARDASTSIFCRNVMIYFDEETQNRIWSRFAAALDPGGMPVYRPFRTRLRRPRRSIWSAQTTYRLREGGAA